MREGDSNSLKVKLILGSRLVLDSYSRISDLIHAGELLKKNH